MAGASSEVGYGNIARAPKTSGHLEIEHEIKVVEATDDTNEVCGLERNKCDEIIEHLKKNPGLVVKSLGPEGQTVLHIAITAGETKKQKPSTYKCIDKEFTQFSEAANDSNWYEALKWNDCKALMSLLQENPCLIAQTGPGGETVLHAAVARGCLKLLDQVFDLFEDTNQFVDEMSGVKIGLHDLLRAKSGSFKSEAQHKAWFTCPRQVWEALIWGGRFVESFSSIQRSTSDASQYLMDKLFEIMQGETSKKAFESLKKDYQSNKDYNFVCEPKELQVLQFHYACRQMRSKPTAKDYVKTIISECRELESSVEVLTYLLQLLNAQGETPIHVASTFGCRHQLLQELASTSITYYKCLHAKDVRGWTILHQFVANRNHDDLDAVLKDEQIDVNIRTSSTMSGISADEFKEAGMTALHLAILHNDVRSVELLLQCPHIDVNALFFRDIVCGYEIIKPGDDFSNYQERRMWSPLQLASIMGLSNVIRALLVWKLGDIDDDGKLQNNMIVEKKFRGASALLLASASGNPNTLRLFLDNPKFNPLVTFEGATSLHYATYAVIPTITKSEDHKVSRFIFFSDLGYLDRDPYSYEEEPKDIKLTPTSYLGRQACITMLLQAGVDIWEKDNQERLADPGPQAPEEAHLWWHEQMAQETLEAKKSLNDAANAISIVAALVATASFVGPLQPPLGYGGDSMEGGVQDTHLSIRVFMVSNILSFYLAIASILFAVAPSLPMPQEGIYAEWQRTRRTVGVAIFFLLMSVLGVLISFGAASNSVVSKDYSWRHVGLSFYPTLMGGFICILGISLFFLRLLRLVFNRNAKIRYLYKTFVKF